MSYIINDLLKELLKIPELKRESEEIQHKIALLVADGLSKYRQHEYFENAISYHYKELYAAFGRGVTGKTGFQAVNDRIQFFEVTTAYSKDRHHTRGYWFTPKVKAVLDKYFDRRWRRDTLLFKPDGSVLATIPAAVASKDSDEVTAKAWRKTRELEPAVKVDLDNLEALRKWLTQGRDMYLTGRSPSDLVTTYPNLEEMQFLIQQTAIVIRMAKTKLAGAGFIAQQYVEATSGRLYAKGINLQNTPSLIKEAALYGLWEYDLSNCHWDIVRQLAAQYGCACPAIDHYLAHKKTVRKAIAAEAEISENHAKVCLLAIMYGAKKSTWHDTAIPQAIGEKAAKRLYKVELFEGLSNDIDKARTAIVKNYPRNQRGHLSNAMGKPIDGKEPKKKILAHLIQGVEAQMLNTVIDLHPKDIVLLQHDGFAANKKLDTQTLVQRIEQTTGYKMQLEDKQIKINPDAYFLKNSFQPETKLKANAGAVLHISGAS
jgi:hypothetical protein